MRAVPWLVLMVLTDPAAVVAADAADRHDRAPITRLDGKSFMSKIGELYPTSAGTPLPHHGCKRREANRG